MMNLFVAEYPPQIITAHLDGEELRLALPETSLIIAQQDPRKFSGLIHCRIRGSTYCRFPYPFGTWRLFRRNSPEEVIDNFWKDFYFRTENTHFGTLHVNESLQINSLKQWHHLTQQNPDFMRQQFDPKVQAKKIKDVRIIDRQRAMIHNVPPFLADDSKSLTVNAKIFPPHTRTIHVSESSRFLLSLPKVAIIMTQPEKKLLCLANTRDDTYVPLYLPNVCPLGITCTGTDFQNHIHKPFDYFWHSYFNDTTNMPNQISPKLTVKSLSYWQKFTKENPNFFQDQLDPIHMEKHSHILYNLQGNRLSWILQ